MCEDKEYDFSSANMLTIIEILLRSHVLSEID